MSSTLLVVDTETTGLEAPDHKAVEVAAVLVKSGRITAAFTTYLNPGRSIPPAASAVHGLVDADVADAPTWEETIPWLNGLAAKADAVVAHNAPFDRSMMPGMVDKPWLDTLRLARKLLPDEPSHTNQALRYSLGLHCPEASGMPAHRALADAYVTARLAVRLLDLAASAGLPGEMAALVEDLSRPMLLRRCNFGKHKGSLWSEIPADYLQWMAKQRDLEPDVVFTVRHYLGA